MRVLILYFSGFVSTKMVAEKIFTALKTEHNVHIFSIENVPNSLDISEYNAVIIGFPTYHSSPAKPMVKYLETLSMPSKPIPAFIFTTCGLYSTNTLRIFAKKCINKNIAPIICRSYRCAATDGSLVAPFMSIWFHHEKNLIKKIELDCSSFISLIKKNIKPRLPRFKFYSILNYPNKLLGKLFPFPIFLHKSRCIKCQKCITNCPSQCISKDNEDYPLINSKKCFHCYRCIHNCPKMALSLSKNKAPSKTLLNH